MPIVVAPGLALLAQIQPEMEVTYSENGVYYAGRIRTITPADYWRADYLTLDVECQDYTSLLVDDICTSARSVPETDAQRISWLLQNFDRHGISAHHVQTLYSNMPNQDFTGLTLTAAITAVLAFSGGVFYVDDFKDLHTFVATENLTAPFALSDNPDGVTNFGYNSFRYPADSVDLRNAVLAIPPVSTYTAVDTLTETITYAPGAVTGGGCIASFKPRANGFISLVAAGPIAIGSTTSVSPTFASQTQAGNLAIAGVGAGTFDPTTSAPGWIKAVGETFGGPFNAIWYKANVSNGEIAPTFTAVGGSSAMFAQLIEISGADPINPLDRTGSSGTASTTLVIPNSAGDTGADFVFAATRWILNAGSGPTFVDSLNNNLITSHSFADFSTGGLERAMSFTYGLPSTLRPTWYTNDASIAQYGRREAALTAPSSVTTQAALDALGTAYITAHAFPLHHASLLLPPGSPAGLVAGQTVPVTNSLYGLTAQPYQIQSVDVTYPADNLPQFAVQFGDPAITVTTQMVALQAKIGASTSATATGSSLGTLGYAQVTANQTGITAQVDVTGLTVTVTVLTGRRIQITAYLNLLDATTTDSMAVYIMEGATQLAVAGLNAPLNGQSQVATPSVVLTPTAAAHTYKIQVARSSGAGSITVSASATIPAFILCEDIGV